MSSKPPVQPTGGPAPPRTMRTLRKYQSHQTLSSRNNPSQTHQRSARLSGGPEELSRLTQLDPSRRPHGPHRRTRSNSDAGPNEPAQQTQRRPARRTGSGFGVKKSVLESLLRDGPQNGNIMEGLQELRYLVLSNRLDADADGMVCSLKACLLSN